jgi:hypothetical protein
MRPALVFLLGVSFIMQRCRNKNYHILILAESFAKIIFVLDFAQFLTLFAKKTTKYLWKIIEFVC